MRLVASSSDVMVYWNVDGSTVDSLVFNLGENIVSKGVNGELKN
jgi:hypothetical protein